MFGLTIALREKAPNVKFSWVYNGREDVESMTTCGLLFLTFPLALNLTPEMDIRDVYQNVSDQVAKCIEHSCYPYMHRGSDVVEDDTACLLYQSDIRDVNANGMVLEQVPVRQNNAASQSIMDMDILDGQNGLQLLIHYAGSLYEQSTIETFTDFFIRICSILVKHNDQSALTISDIRKQALSGTGFFAKLFGVK